jgi:hypothetical protein
MSFRSPTQNTWYSSCAVNAVNLVQASSCGNRGCAPSHRSHAHGSCPQSSPYCEAPILLAQTPRRPTIIPHQISPSSTPRDAVDRIRHALVACSKHGARHGGPEALVHQIMPSSHPPQASPQLVTPIRTTPQRGYRQRLIPHRSGAADISFATASQ